LDVFREPLDPEEDIITTSNGTPAEISGNKTSNKPHVYDIHVTVAPKDSDRGNPVPITPEAQSVATTTRQIRTAESQKRVDNLRDLVLTAVTDFRDYFLHNFELKLDQCRAHKHDGESYTLDQDIIQAYESITVEDWYDQAPKKRPSPQLIASPDPG